MTLNPKDRPKLEDVLSHPWMQGAVASPDEIQTEFKRRKNIVDEEAHNEREQKRKQRDADAKTRVRRGAESGPDGEAATATRPVREIRVERIHPRSVEEDFILHFR